MRITLLLLLSILFFSCKSKEEEPQKADQWEMVEKKVYSYRLNSLGYPDTTFIKTYKYKNFDIADSTLRFAVNSYADGLLTGKTYYKLEKSVPTMEAQIRYTYQNKNLATVNITNKGVLEKSEKYFYDTANRLIRYSSIQAKSAQPLPDQTDVDLTNERKIVEGYDTLNVTYVYDNTNKNIGATFTNNSGTIFRKDVNLYSGNMPLASYNLSGTGDTLQRLEYALDGKLFRSKVDNDSLTIINWMNNGFLVGKITLDKKKNQQYKNQIIYDQSRIAEERHFRLVR